MVENTLIFKSKTDRRSLHVLDSRPKTSSLVSSLNEWEVIEVPRRAKNERPFRMVVSDDDKALENAANVILAVDADAKFSGRSHLKLKDGVLKRISYKEAVELGLVARISVLSLD